MKRKQMLRSFPTLVALITLCGMLPISAVQAEDSFTVVLLPDTQNYSEKFPETYYAQTEWIRDRAEADDIRFAIHLGDLVQHFHAEDQWKVADKAHQILDGKVPYSVVPGNHDMDQKDKKVKRTHALYRKYFPPERFEGQKWYGGHKDDDNVNNYCLFEAGGMKFMVLSLEFAPSDETIEWANKVVMRHRKRRVIVATHYYMRPEGRVDEKRPYGLDGAGPEELWQKLISKRPNIFMVVSGHVLGTQHQASINKAGKPVHEILCDYQGEANGGDGWLQALRFVPAEDKIYVDAYSPTLDRHWDGPLHTFTLDYAMEEPKDIRRHNPAARSWPNN